MNIKLNLKIKYKDKSKEPLTIVSNTLLKPFYVTEEEILSVYLQEYKNDFVQKAREIIFYASVQSDEYFKIHLKAKLNDELYSLKRQLAYCLAIKAFGNKYNTDFVKSMSRTKTLADFTVSTTIGNDITFLSNIVSDADACIEDIKGIVAELNSSNCLINTFIIGGDSLTALAKDPSRLWWHRGLPYSSVETHASLKTNFNGRYYKNGGNYATKPRIINR